MTSRDVHLKLLKMAIRNADISEASTYFQDLKNSLPAIHKQLFKISCQSGFFCFIRDFIQNYPTFNEHKTIQWINLLIVYIKNRNDHVFFPQLAFYYVAFFFDTDWIMEDNNVWLDDDDIRLSIIKRFSGEPKVILGWALCAAAYLLCNLDHGNLLTYVFHFLRVTRNFLLHKSMRDLWDVINIVIDHDASLLSLKPWIDMLRSTCLEKESNFSSIQRAALACLSLTLIGKIQDQSVNASTVMLLPSHTVSQYRLNYNTIPLKIPIHGEYFNQIFAEHGKVSMFVAVATQYDRIKVGTVRPNIAQYIQESSKLPLPSIDLDTVTPFLNRFFTNAPWVGNIFPTCVHHIYEVHEPEHLLISGTYDLDGTKIIKKWQMFWHIMRITRCFNITINDMCNGGYYYVSHPYVSILLNENSEWYKTFFYIYQIGRYLIGAPSVVEPSDVLMAEDGTPSFFAGCLKRSRVPFSESECAKALAAFSGKFESGILKMIKKNMQTEENSTLLNEPSNTIHLQTNTWLSKLEHVETLSL